MARSAAVLKLEHEKRRRTYRRTDLSDQQIRIMKDLIEYEGLSFMAREIGVSEMSLLRVCCGWLDRCNTNVRQKVLAFFGTDEHTY